MLLLHSGPPVPPLLLWPHSRDHDQDRTNGRAHLHHRSGPGPSSLVPRAGTGLAILYRAAAPAGPSLSARAQKDPNLHLDLAAVRIVIQPGGCKTAAQQAQEQAQARAEAERQAQQHAARTRLSVARAHANCKPQRPTATLCARRPAPTFPYRRIIFDLATDGIPPSLPTRLTSSASYREHPLRRSFSSVLTSPTVLPSCTILSGPALLIQPLETPSPGPPTPLVDPHPEPVPRREQGACVAPASVTRPRPFPSPPPRIGRNRWSDPDHSSDQVSRGSPRVPRSCLEAL